MNYNTLSPGGSMKILILMSYFNRPLLLKNALNSILKADEHHSNWELAFADDNSKIPGRPIVEEILKEHLKKIRFFNTGMSLADKLKDGICLGKYGNIAIRESAADVAIIL